MEFGHVIHRGEHASLLGDTVDSNMIGILRPVGAPTDRSRYGAHLNSRHRAWRRPHIPPVPT
jgi:hypothetical protein